MQRPLRILLIAPAAPPKNSPESMQVGRYMHELARECDITLVTTPVELGWVKADVSLIDEAAELNRITLSLPLHGWSKRVLASRYISRYLQPDADVWLTLKVGEIVRRLDAPPDIIYSRSSPMSAALLAKALKARLNVPWMMHLSDPWAGGFYRRQDARYVKADSRDEESCVKMADRITVTTEQQAELLRVRYPKATSKIAVLPNVMPLEIAPLPSRVSMKKLHIVYTGAFYGERRPFTILEALDRLWKLNPEIADRIQLSFFGNMETSTEKDIRGRGLDNVLVGDPVDYVTAKNLAMSADILLSVEPDKNELMYRSIMPAKILDYLAWRRPILAITPKGSPTWDLCEKGYGWAFRADDSKGVMNQLYKLTNVGDNSHLLNLPLPPKEYSAQSASKMLHRWMSEMV